MKLAMFKMEGRKTRKVGVVPAPAPAQRSAQTGSMAASRRRVEIGTQRCIAHLALLCRPRRLIGLQLLESRHMHGHTNQTRH